LIKQSLSRRLFVIINTLFLSILSFLCLMPMLHLLATSLSAKSAVDAGWVTIWPVHFTLGSYEVVLERADFFSSIMISVKRVAIGLVINMVLTVMCAYPLSKEESKFKGRTAYAWFFIITILFSGGLIPTYMVIRQLNLINSIWSLILPGAVPVWNIVLMLNFFRGLPKEIEESAFMDGAGHVRVMAQFYVPLSAPSIATIALFTIVGHWNAWFDGMIYMNKQSMYPLQTFLRMIQITVDTARTHMSSDTARNIMQVSDRTLRSAQVFIGLLPVLCIYPFLQKYFTKGIVLGSVKG